MNAEHRAALAHGHHLDFGGDIVLRQITAERPPDLVVVAGAHLAVFPGLPLDAERTVLDDGARRTQRDDAIDPGDGRSDVDHHVGEDVDQPPFVRRQAGERSVGAALARFARPSELVIRRKRFQERVAPRPRADRRPQQDIGQICGFAVPCSSAGSCWS